MTQQAPPTAQDKDASVDLSAERAAGKQALHDLLAPVNKRLTAGRILAALSGIFAIAPYIALVQLGETLLRAAVGSEARRSYSQADGFSTQPSTAFLV